MPIGVPCREKLCRCRLSSLVPTLAAAQGPARSISISSKPRSSPPPTGSSSSSPGQTDPRLKGYITPVGIKVEIVADFPDIVNPVGMTFGPDGTLYVLEWVEPVSIAEEIIDFIYKDGTKRKVRHHEETHQGPRQDARLYAKKGVLRFGQGRARRTNCRPAFLSMMAGCI